MRIGVQFFFFALAKVGNASFNSFCLCLYGVSNLILGVLNRFNCILSIYISSVIYESTITIVHLHILQEMNVMHTCSDDVKGMDDSTKSKDYMEFISVIIHFLGDVQYPIDGTLSESFLYIPQCLERENGILQSPSSQSINNFLSSIFLPFFP